MAVHLKQRSAVEDRRTFALYLATTGQEIDTAVRLAAEELAVRADVYRDLRGDLDNMSKVLLDSLSGVAFVDDSQVWDLRLVRHLDRQNPRVELTIAPLEAA